MLYTNEQLKEMKRVKEERYFKSQLHDNPDLLVVWDGKKQVTIGEGGTYSDGVSFLKHRLAVNDNSFDKLFKEIDLDDFLTYLEYDPDDFLDYVTDDYGEKVNDFVSDKYGD